MKNISERLKYMLEKKGWTAYKLSMKSNIAQSTIGNILKNPAGNFNTSTFTSISNALGVSREWLVNGKGSFDMVQEDSANYKVGLISEELRKKFKGIRLEEHVLYIMDNKEDYLNNGLFKLFIENEAKDILNKKYLDKIEYLESITKKIEKNK